MKSLMEVCAASILIIGISGIICIPAVGQTSTGQQVSPDINNMTQTPKPGTPHDYLKDMVEIVNPANGQLSIRVAAPMPADRGSLDQSLYAYMYDSGYYHLNLQLSPSWAYTGSSISPKNWMTMNSIGWGAVEGRPTGPGQVYLKTNTFTYYATDPFGWASIAPTCSYKSDYIYEDMHGGLHPLGITFIGPGSNYTNCTFYYTNLHNQLTGGDLQYKAQVDPASGEVIAIYDAHGNLVDRGEDPNGNRMHGSGRVATLSGTSLTVPGLGNPYTTTTGAQMKVTPPAAVNSLTLLNPDSSSVDMCGTNTSVTTSSPLSVNVPQSVTLGLPNKQSYSFQWDPTYGNINQITYPTGATVKYVWTTLSNAEAAGFILPSTYSQTSSYCQYRYNPVVVQSRTVSFDGVSNSQEQDFSYYTDWGAGNPLLWKAKVTTLTTKDLLTTGSPSYKTVYTYVPGVGNQASDSFVSSSPEALENTINYYDTKGNLLRRVTKMWSGNDQMVAECTTLPSGQSAGIFYTYAPSGVSGIIAEANATNVVTDKSEYDYGSVQVSIISNSTVTGEMITSCTRPSAVPARETVTAYHTFTPTSLVPAYHTMLDRPDSVKIYDLGTLIAETDYEYDKGTVAAVGPNPPHAHDETNYGPSSRNSRGNATRITKKCFQAGCQNVVTQVGYDETGQAVSVTDTYGKTTTLTYDDNFTSDDGAPPSGYSTNLYLKTLTRPATNGKSHTQTFQWDYNKGVLRSSQDVENNQTTYYHYDDPWARLTESDFPDGGQTSVSYNDIDAMATPYDPVVDTKVLLSAGVQKETSVESDPIGHPILTKLISDPAGTVSVKTSYDGFGNVASVTNPYRSGDTVYTTSYTYDSLGRKTVQTNPDKTTVQWCYDNIASSGQTNCRASLGGSGEWVDTQDENGSDWQRVSNGFGQLTAVFEPNGTSRTPSMETDYQYDVLGNLLCAVQKGGDTGAFTGCTSAPSKWRPRSFVYDSLSQLLYAYNPETGGVNYTYDGNGNVATKTDARHITTIYGYDDLNRQISKNYKNDTSKTPISCFQYDISSLAGTGANLVGRLTNQWTQAAGTSCPAAVPSFGSYLTLRAVLAYDLMGRIWSETQCTTSGCRSSSPCSTASGNQSYSYDLAGNLKCYGNGLASTSGTTTNPVAFTLNYDTAGRLLNLGSNWADPKNRNFPAKLLTAQSNSAGPCGASASYTASGALANAILGNGVTVSRNYDSRLRVTCENDTGGLIATPTPGSGTITITGTEQTK